MESVENVFLGNILLLLNHNLLVERCSGHTKSRAEHSWLGTKSVKGPYLTKGCRTRILIGKFHLLLENSLLA